MASRRGSRGARAMVGVRPPATAPLSALDAGSVREAPKHRARKVFYNLGRFSKVVSDFESLHAQRAPAERLAAFVEYALQRGAAGARGGAAVVGLRHVDAARITTVHRAKGLQRPAVFCGVGQGCFPMASETSLWSLAPRAAVRAPERYESSEEDERRLFYVAVTSRERVPFASC